MNQNIVRFFLCLGALCLGAWMSFIPQEPIKVGVLHSLTGPLAVGEKPVVDAVLMAIDEINSRGGLLGRLIEPVVLDGRSNPQVFAEQAEILIKKKGVDVIFGCWSSASRKAVKPIVEAHKNLLFYPMQYEGAELSDHIIYTGATQNQQLSPGINWCVEQLGKNFFIVGSDYVYPRVSGLIIHDLLESLGATIVGEEYLVLETDEVQAVVKAIKDTKPDAILNLINGTTNRHFFKALRESGVTSLDVPTMSFSIPENEIKHIGTPLVVGDYVAWSYFQSLQTEENKQFIQSFRIRYGKDRVISDPMEAGYVGVYLWSQAVELVGSSEPGEVLKGIHNQSIRAPEGMFYIDGFNHHSWKFARIARIADDGYFQEVWSSDKPIYPIVYPYKSAKEWQKILHEFYAQWGGSWAR